MVDKREKAMRESTVERVLQKSIKAQGGWCLKFTSPGTAGVPDRVCLLPGGVLAFVELKAPGRHVKDGSLQEFWGKELQRLGFRWYEISSTEEARALAQRLGTASREITGVKPSKPGKEVSKGG